MFDNITTADRIDIAKKKTKNVVDYLCFSLHLHENNQIIVYSPQLSEQIPRSMAANSFNVFQASMHQLEIIKLCALWDAPKRNRESIPTIIELIDDSRAIDTLVAETYDAHNQMGHLTNPPEDPEEYAIIRDLILEGRREFAQKQATKARIKLRAVIKYSRAIQSSNRLQAVMNLRHKRLAHYLTKSYQEEKTGPIDLMKYGDEHHILSATKRIVETLYCYINGTSFDLSESQEISRKYARALWDECTFAVKK